MEDQWLKSNTDCVYYLASPLTCKKGIECEFRHSEPARLNPIDCWYWLAGNCLNPDCAFRHPPFVGPNDGSLESANIYKQHASSSKTANVPCHFFFSGFCNKGEMCSFSHGLSSNAHQHSKKTTMAIVSKPTIEKRINPGNNIGSDAPARTVNIPLQKAGSNIKQLTPVKDKLPSSDENALHRVHIKEKKSRASTDKSSGTHLMSGSEEQEELFDSSPGFDVQVNDVSEEFTYEDYPNRFQYESKKRTKLMGHPYEEVDSNCDCVGVHCRLGKRLSEFQPPNRRNFNQSPHDLLRKFRSMNNNHQDSFSRNSQSEEKYQQLQRRLGPKVGSNHLQSRIDDERRSFMRNNSNHQNQRRQGFDSYSKKRLPSGDYLVLKRPQEFSPVREAKRRYGNEVSHSRDRRDTSSATVENEFLGPKSLTEILREKRMGGAVVTSH